MQQKVLKGGVKKTISETENDVLNFTKTIPERDHLTIDRKRLTTVVLDRSLFMLFVNHPVLDSSLPHVNMLVFNTVLLIIGQIDQK